MPLNQFHLPSECFLHFFGEICHEAFRNPVISPHMIESVISVCTGTKTGQKGPKNKKINDKNLLEYR